jgi:hypothetical protein
MLTHSCAIINFDLLEQEVETPPYATEHISGTSKLPAIMYSAVSKKVVAI